MIDIKVRSLDVLAAMRQRLDAIEGLTPEIRSLLIPEFANSSIEPVLCAGNQHTCQSRFFVPALNQHFSTVLTGTGNSVIIGPHNGPRALVWRDTHLEGEDPVLGKMSVRLEPSMEHAGTLIPLTDSPFPALNRNLYFFVFNIAALGDIISDRPAVVEALIDAVPPTASYVFRNGPLNFYRQGDPTKTTVAILEAAVTDVSP